MARSKARSGPHKGRTEPGRIVYHSFPVRHHVKTLQLDKRFLSSITPETKILEVGFGSGKLTSFLMKRSNLDPKNITLLDLDYGSLEYIQSPVRRLIQRGVIKYIKSSVTDHDHPANSYDHILMPEAHFSEMGETLGKLSPALKVNGELRISEINQATFFKLRSVNFFDKFNLEVVVHNGRGLILRKRAALRRSA